MQPAPPRSVEQGVLLGPLCTFGVGGAAAFLARPADVAELCDVLRWCAETGRDYRLIGRGSNVLLPDEGLEEVVIRLGAGFEFTADGTGFLRAGAAYSLPKLAIEACRQGLAGLERFVGIPATLGGAVAMNAGCLGAEIQGVVRRVRLVSPAGEEGWLEAHEMGFAYRRSRLQTIGPAEVCVEVELELGQEAPERLMEVLRTENKRRHQTQPYTLPSAGSVFRNPPGDPAGRLIEKTGLKGLRVGGAEVSPVHANFIVNTGGATATDILELMAAVRNRVLEAQSIALEPEIQLWGRLGQRFLDLSPHRA